MNERFREHQEDTVVWFEDPESDAEMPRIHDTESIPIDQKVLHLRIKSRQRQWYAVEFDPEEKRLYGFVWGGTPAKSGWGYSKLYEFHRLYQGFYGPIVQLSFSIPDRQPWMIDEMLSRRYR